MVRYDRNGGKHRSHPQGHFRVQELHSSLRFRPMSWLRSRGQPCSGHLGMRRSFVRQAGMWGTRTASILVIGLLAQCTVGGPDSIDPDRPYPQVQPSASTPQSGTASLRIFTESYLFGPSEDVEKLKMRYYTGYTLYDQSGRRLAHIPEQAYEPRR